MTRKDYIIIAGALRTTYSAIKHNFEISGSTAYGYELNGVMYAAKSMAINLAADNSNFNIDHFMAVVRGEKDLNSRPAR